MISCSQGCWGQIFAGDRHFFATTSIRILVSMPSWAWVVTARMSNILNFSWYFLCIPAIYRCILAYLPIFFNQLSKFFRCESPSTFLWTCLSHHSFIIFLVTNTNTLLSGLYLISTVPLQKPRFYAVSRACFCRYLSEYSDSSSFSCMLTIWTYLTRYTCLWHWNKYSTKCSYCHPIFSPFSCLIQRFPCLCNCLHICTFSAFDMKWTIQLKTLFW